jgi:guanylate kinase
MSLFISNYNIMVYSYLLLLAGTLNTERCGRELSSIKVLTVYSVVIDTSRTPRVLEEDGRGYWFIDRETMEEDIRQHNFLEYGEHNGNLYGTKLDSIRDVIRQGKMCVLDCSPAVSTLLLNYVCG